MSAILHACSASPAASWASASTSETKKSLRPKAASDALRLLLEEAVHAIDKKIDADRSGPRQDRASDPREAGLKVEVEAISDLPMLNDIDADYSPQYVKLARILRDKIKSGELGRFATLPASDLATEYDVSAPVAYAALGMLAANRYVGRPDGHRFYRVTWNAGHPHAQADR